MENVVLPILWVVVAINVVLGLVILSRGFRNFRNIVFSALATFSAFWSFSIIAFYDSDFSSFTNWLDFTHIFALCVSFSFFTFALFYPKSFERSLIVDIIGGLVFFVAVYFLAVTDYVVGKRILDTNDYVLGKFYFIYGLLVVIFFSLGYIFLFIKYRLEKNKDVKQQIKFVLIGSILASTLALIPDLIFPMVNIFDFTWLGPVFTLIMVFSIFFAMARYHLFNVKILITELFSGLIIFALLVELFYSKTALELVVKSAVMIFVSVANFLLIKGVYREIEQRERIEKLAQDLEKANERLKGLDQMKSEFVSLASHQIRGPLTAIKGYASELMEGDFGDVPKNLSEPIRTIFQSCESLVVIVEDFLNISRIEQGRMKYDIKVFSIGVLVEEVLNELKPNIEKKGLVLKSDLDKNIKINADRGKIKQIIINLFDNAIKYTPRGSIEVKVALEGDNMRFFVKDTGIGISEKTKPKLFQKFSRAEDASKANIMGTGLGLYVASQMVHALGGSIWVESKGQGQGSTFFVEFKAV